MASVNLPARLWLVSPGFCHFSLICVVHLSFMHNLSICNFCDFIVSTREYNIVVPGMG